MRNCRVCVYLVLSDTRLPVGQNDNLQAVRTSPLRYLLRESAEEVMVRHYNDGYDRLNDAHSPCAFPHTQQTNTQAHTHTNTPKQTHMHTHTTHKYVYLRNATLALTSA